MALLRPNYDDPHDCDCRVCEEVRAEVARLREVLETALTFTPEPWLSAGREVLDG